MNQQTAWEQLCKFFANYPTSTISKVFKSFGYNLPVYYIKERGGVPGMIAVDICSKNKMTVNDFKNLFILATNDLNFKEESLDIPWNNPNKMF